MSSLRAVNDDHLNNLGQVQDWAAELPEKFLHCREMGHNWRPLMAGKYKDGGYTRTLRCSRCRMRKTQELSSRGMVIGSPHYTPPEGYYTKGLGAITGEGRGLLRLASLSRIPLQDIEED